MSEAAIEPTRRVGAHPSRILRLWWVALPALAFVELCAHLVQTRARTESTDYASLSAKLQAQVGPNDHVIFAPLWTNPKGRAAMGSWLGASRVGYADLSRFARVFEVSVDGAHTEALHAMPVARTFTEGEITVREHTNPAFKAVTDDLLAHPPNKVHISVSAAARAEGEACAWTRGRSQAGPWDLARPANSFACRDRWVAPIMMLDGEYHERFCFLVSSGGTRIEFEDVRFARELVAHLGFHRAVEQAHAARVTLEFNVRAELPSGVVELRSLGSNTHTAGDNWSEFRVETEALSGQTGSLLVDVSGGPHVCFEVSAR
jgi:hypothetical protein